QLRIEVGDIEVDTPAATAGRQRQELQERAASAIAQDGFVRDMIDTLDASVVESSIKPIA
ncbi:MAG TPA: DNA polymerase III subunit gamma/tau, partial [Myxococcota bacterium]|nr:DNA polymerase III subunit gamma/tau [Myxococcota bacterium]